MAYWGCAYCAISAEQRCDTKENAEKKNCPLRHHASGGESAVLLPGPLETAKTVPGFPVKNSWEENIGKITGGEDYGGKGTSKSVARRRRVQ